MAFDPKTIEDSFEKAKPIAADVAAKFYEILWVDYPQSTDLFAGANMDKQKVALMTSLTQIVDHVRDPEWLTEYLYQMGVRHMQYDTQPEHFDWVGASLLKTFAHFFGDDWTDELQQNWLEAYQAISGLMLAGLNDAMAGDIRKSA
jgi:hemoglobin-like flavoprotein